MKTLVCNYYYYCYKAVLSLVEGSQLTTNCAVIGGACYMFNPVV